MPRPKKKRGRPVKYPLPEPILDAKPEEVAHVTAQRQAKEKVEIRGRVGAVPTATQAGAGLATESWVQFDIIPFV